MSLLAPYFSRPPVFQYVLVSVYQCRFPLHSVIVYNCPSILVADSEFLLRGLKY